MVLGKEDMDAELEDFDMEFVQFFWTRLSRRPVVAYSSQWKWGLWLTSDLGYYVSEKLVTKSFI